MSISGAKNLGHSRRYWFAPEKIPWWLVPAGYFPVAVCSYPLDPVLSHGGQYPREGFSTRRPIATQTIPSIPKVSNSRRKNCEDQESSPKTALKNDCQLDTQTSRCARAIREREGSHVLRLSLQWPGLTRANDPPFLCDCDNFLVLFQNASLRLESATNEKSMRRKKIIQKISFLVCEVTLESPVRRVVKFRP